MQSAPNLHASLPVAGGTMRGRVPQYGWTHSRNPEQADDLARSWNAASYRGRPEVALPNAPLSESMGTMWAKLQNRPKIKREFRNCYLPNYCDLRTTPAKNYHPFLTGCEELQKTCFPGRGHPHMKADMSWAKATHPAGQFWKTSGVEPVTMPVGSVGGMRMPAYDMPTRQPCPELLHRAVSDGSIRGGGSRGGSEYLDF